MATLLTVTGEGENVRTPIFKSLTTVGADPDSDVTLKGSGIPPVAARILRDGDTFTISTVDRKYEIVVSGKRTRKQILVDGDEIDIGAVRLRFYSGEPPEPKATGAISEDDKREMELTAYERLAQFSQRLGEEKEIPVLLNALMDEVINLTRAEKGFLVLFDGDAPQVKVARSIKGESLDDPEKLLSDSILAKVMRTSAPIVVSDALNDSEFNSSVSVINLKLVSVMCAPLMHQGELFGAIYVGNNSVVSLFDELALKVLTVYAGQASLLVQNALHVNALELEAEDLRTRLEISRYGDLIGSCDGMKQVFKKVDKVAPTDVSVLVTGETGTGKELIARELHQRSPRKDGPFVVINCGAIPENLLESELFGHVRGAFTGAVATRAGKFQAADKGTLFLDEIGEMPLPLQVKILRALQDRKVTKVGDTKTDDVDIRVVAATHRNLDQMVREQTFREDLYYRLNVVHLHLPPLRERGDDVVVLANYLLQKYAGEYEKKIRGFTKKGVTAMLRYAWPGNVRQLENRIKRAMVLCEGNQIAPDDLDILAEDLEDILPLSDALERFRRRYINEALDRNAGNRTKTARELGVDPRTIFRHLEAERKDDV
jgi:transcriptional regulator with GAF, ATPase, and Fis domain